MHLPKKVKRKATIVITADDDGARQNDLTVEIKLDPPVGPGETSSLRVLVNMFLKILHEGSEETDVYASD